MMAAGIKKIGDDSDSVYNTDWYKESVAKAERGNREHIAKFDRSFNGVMAKAAADDDEMMISAMTATKPVVMTSTMLSPSRITKFRSLQTC